MHRVTSYSVGEAAEVCCPDFSVDSQLLLVFSTLVDTIGSV